MPIQSAAPEFTSVNTDSTLPYSAPASHQHLKPAHFGNILTLGFAITVAVWITAYICRMPVVHASGPVTVSAMLLVILLGGIAAGRYSLRPLTAGLLAGTISGALDILIVGSLLTDYMKTHDKALIPSATLWIGGSLLLNTLVAGLGALLGKFLPSPNRHLIRWPRVFALTLCAATLPLITAGGLVTAYGVGMAVPDWPTSYEYNMFLFPLSLMQSDHGNFYEHAHRLMGSLVGLTTLAFAIYLSCVDRRKWVITFTWIVFLSVCFQGYLGGTRVTANSVPLAIAHGIFAQIVFAAMAALVAITSRSFITLKGKIPEANSTDWALSILFLLAMIAQLTMGALLRHLNIGLLLHITFAVFVALIGLAAGMRAWGLDNHFPPLKRAGVALMSLICLQLLLGILALVFRTVAPDPRTLTHAMMTTLHQANGALLLAVGAILATYTFRAVRLLDPTPPESLAPAQ